MGLPLGAAACDGGRAREPLKQVGRQPLFLFPGGFAPRRDPERDEDVVELELDNALKGRDATEVEVMEPGEEVVQVGRHKVVGHGCHLGRRVSCRESKAAAEQPAKRATQR